VTGPYATCQGRAGSAAGGACGGGDITQPQADALQRWQADAYLAGLMPACIGGYRQGGSTAARASCRIFALRPKPGGTTPLRSWPRSTDAVATLDAVAVQGQSAGALVHAEGRAGHPARRSNG
jgi:hypothetical protein